MSGALIAHWRGAAGLRAAAGLAALVTYGNVAALVFAGELPGGSWLAVALGLLFSGVVLLTAVRSSLGPSELGLRIRGTPHAALLGTAVAVVTATVGLVVLRYPPLLGEPVSYPPAATASAAASFPLHLAVFLPLAVVVPEELAFRGLLLARLLRRYPVVRAVLLSAAIYSAWHVAVVLITIGRTNLAADPLFTALGIAGAFAAIAAGGIAFAALRLRTGNLAAPIAAHWVFNAAILMGLQAMRTV